LLRAGGEGTGGGEGTREQERWRDWRPRAVCSRMVQRKDGTEPSLRHRWSGRIRGQCVSWMSREEGQSNSRAFIRRAVRPITRVGPWGGGGRLTQRHRRRHRRRSRERRELLRGRMPRWQRASATRTQGGLAREEPKEARGDVGEGEGKGGQRGAPVRGHRRANYPRACRPETGGDS
jgi:hypothetical protein